MDFGGFYLFGLLVLVVLAYGMRVVILYARRVVAGLCEAGRSRYAAVTAYRTCIAAGGERSSPAVK
jgi:hypothetical protein